jgi:uncharacterized protein (TIGR03435 family)
MPMRSYRILALISIGFLSTVASKAQTKRDPEFEVATVKVAVPVGDKIDINLGTIRNGRVTLGNVTLSDSLKFAYSIVADSLIDGPAWIRSGELRFNIVGQAPADTPDDQLRLMVRTLLTERLKVSIHHEQKDLPFLALTIGRNGPKLAAPKDTAGTPQLVAGRIIHDRMPMSVFVMLLSRFERQTVVNTTPLTGPYAINLQWTTDTIRALARPDGGPVSINGQSVDAYGPSLYTAIQEQLGLRLESRKGPIEVLVVDSAEKMPADN